MPLLRGPTETAIRVLSYDPLQSTGVGSVLGMELRSAEILSSTAAYREIQGGFRT